jgi:hypothetical protein
MNGSQPRTRALRQNRCNHPPAHLLAPCVPCPPARSPLQVALIVPLLVGVYFLQRVYSAGAVSIRSKEAGARKPALTVAADVLSGLQTLQAFHKQGLVEARMAAAVRGSAAWYSAYIGSERQAGRLAGGQAGCMSHACRAAGWLHVARMQGGRLAARRTHAGRQAGCMSHACRACPNRRKPPGQACLPACWLRRPPSRAGMHSPLHTGQLRSAVAAIRVQAWPGWPSAPMSCSLG